MFDVYFYDISLFPLSSLENSSPISDFQHSAYVKKDSPKTIKEIYKQKFTDIWFCSPDVETESDFLLISCILQLFVSFDNPK